MLGKAGTYVFCIEMETWENEVVTINIIPIEFQKPWFRPSQLIFCSRNMKAICFSMSFCQQKLGFCVEMETWETKVTIETLILHYQYMPLAKFISPSCPNSYHALIPSCRLTS